LGRGRRGTRREGEGWGRAGDGREIGGKQAAEKVRV
jgi:hypothetical protein